MNTHALDGFLCCFAGPNQYALRGKDVTLVARAEEVRAQAGDDRRVGVLTRRGPDIPVYSLSELIGGARDARVRDRHVIVTGAPGAAYGILVDRIVRAAGAGGTVLPLPSIVAGHAARWFAGLLTLKETSCLVLSPDGLRPGGAATTHAAATSVRAGARPGDEIRSLVLTFSTGALPAVSGIDLFAVSATRADAVVQSLSLVSLPGSEPHVAALGCWRGSAVAVLDYSAGAYATSAARRFLVMRSADGARAAIGIEADTSLRRATAQDVRAAVRAPDYVRGIFRVGGAGVALLDVDRLASGAVAIAVPGAHSPLVPALV